MKLYICNKRALEKIIEDFPNKETNKQTKSEQIEELANIFIHDYICLMFTNGKNYFK